MGPSQMRDTLFGDIPLDHFPEGGQPSDEFPWGAFVAARMDLRTGNRTGAFSQWRRVLDTPGLEPRHYLQAWHFLRQQAEQPPRHLAKQLLGMVVEVAMPEGLDVLAAYPDHSARYYNYSGAGVVWEHPDASLDPAIDQLLSASQEVVAKIGPWEQGRPPAPPPGHTRLSFLTPSGLHFGEGPTDALSRDPLAWRVFHLAKGLMGALVAKTSGA